MPAQDWNLNGTFGPDAQSHSRVLVMSACVYMTKLVQISDALVGAQNPTQAMIDALAIIQDALGARMVPMYLLNAAGTELVLLADPEQERWLDERGFSRMPAHEHVRAPWVNPHEWPVSARDHLDHESWKLLPQEFKGWFGTSGIVASVHADGRHLGAFLPVFDGEFVLTPVVSDFLAAAGRVIGGAVHRLQTESRERELGALEERRRLGDELHSDLSQQVAALGLRIDALRIDAENGLYDQIPEELTSLRSFITGMQTGLREQMLGLRADADLVDGSLMGHFRNRVSTFRDQQMMNIVVECVDEDAVDAIPIAIGAQLLRVLHEALANAHFHARADLVTVRISAARTKIALEVEDDGIGFDLDAIADRRLGLRIMQERMEQLDGSLKVDRLPRGTRVRAEVPIRTRPAAFDGSGYEVKTNA